MEIDANSLSSAKEQRPERKAAQMGKLKISKAYNTGEL